MNHIFSKIALIALFILISFSSFQSYKLENSKRVLKQDLIVLSDIKYGMFNVDEWKKQFAKIIINRIKELKLKGKDRVVAQKKIKKLLYEVIEKFELNYKKENRQKALFGISLKNIGADIFEIFDKLRKNVPKITEEIINFLEKKENRESIKDFILLQLDKYRDSTFQKVDYSALNAILENYNSTTKENCQTQIHNAIKVVDEKINSYNLMILIVYILVLISMLIRKKHTTFSIPFYIFIAFQLLLLGVLLPMIDIDARIGLMEFNLIGETISFKDQILYYKSKSIIEMSKLMVQQEKIRVIVVGILVITFSLVFPLLKLLSSLILIFKRQLIQNSIVSFLVFKSGKWSMADVMVVAIFMSYIGFSGIISSQLDQLEKISTNINILTTNNSELQNGFYFFLGFVIMSICISQILINQSKKPITTTKLDPM